MKYGFCNSSGDTVIKYIVPFWCCHGAFAAGAHVIRRLRYVCICGAHLAHVRATEVVWLCNRSSSTHRIAGHPMTLQKFAPRSADRPTNERREKSLRVWKKQSCIREMYIKYNLLRMAIVFSFATASRLLFMDTLLALFAGDSSDELATRATLAMKKQNEKKNGNSTTNQVMHNIKWRYIHSLHTLACMLFGSLMALQVLQT